MEMSMRNDGRLDIACRYIPHDQWITTHIEPTWKIRVVKQWILSKCTGAPFDAPPSQAPLHVHVPPIRQSRKRAHGSKKTPTEPGDSTGGGERPVSPITFAPDPRQRPVSPILFARAGTVGKERRRPKDAVADGAGLTRAGAATPTMAGAAGGAGDADEVAEEKDDDKEGYEEDDEWDTAEEFDDDDDDLDLSLPSGSSSPLPMGGAVLPASRKLLSALHSPHNGKADLTPAGTYTLIRFSTGQILEDEYVVSWYNLAPHELLELHSHVIQPSERPPQVSGHKHTRNASIFSTATSGQAESAHTPETRYLPRLNRTSLATYVLPYFEGWVLALRVVWREDPLLASSFYGGGGGYAGAGFGPGFGHAIESAYGLPNDRSRGRRRGQREGGADKAAEGKELGGGKGEQGRAGRTTSLQWRARWLVVKEGWVRLYRTREETTPTHELPLSALMTLRGQEHLERGAHPAPKKTTRHGRDKPHREYGADTMHGYNAQGIRTASIQGKISSRDPRSLPLSRSQSRSHTDHSSDSHSDGHTPGGAATVGREKYRDRGSAGAHGLGSTGGAEPAHADGEEERRVVCMKFRSRNTWAVAPPSAPVPAAGEPRRYASTLAGYGGGALDGLGMGITSFAIGGHGAAEKDGKTKGKGKEKEKVEKKLKGKLEKEKRLDKRSLEQVLAVGVGAGGGDGQSPYLRKPTVSGAGVSSRTFVGGERKGKGRTRAFGGRSKDKNKEKENEGGMSLGMSLGLGLGFGSVLDGKKRGKEEKKLQKVDQMGSRATLDSQATTSTLVSSWAAGTGASHATVQTMEAASSSSHARSGVVSSGDDEQLSELDEEGTHEDDEGDEDGASGRWATVENDEDSSSGGEVRFAPLSPGARVVSDDDDVDGYNYETATNGSRMLAKVVSDEDDAGGSAPSDPGTTPHKHLHPQVDLGNVSDSESVALSDPVFAHSDQDCSDDDDELGCPEGISVDADGKSSRYGYRYGYRYETVRVARWDIDGKKDSTETETVNAQKDEKEDRIQKARLKEEARRRERERKEKEKGEWVILDMGADLAYSSFLRILHRHFPTPISSSFISGFPTFSTPTPLSTPTPTPTPTPFPSPTSPHPPVFAAPFLWPSSPGTLSGKADDIKMGIHDPEPPSPLSTSSHSSRFHSDPPQHPPALAALTVNTPLSVPKTFGALPYPEWRMEVVERAQKAGMGNVGRAMRWVLWGCADQLADDLAEMQSRKEEGDETDDDPPKPKGRMRSFTLKNRRQSTTSTAEIKPGSIYDSDVSEDTGKILMNMSDSEGESSEVEWHGWMADLHRQHQVQAQKEREAVEAALRPPEEEEGEGEEAPPKNLAEDQRRYQEQRRALEPYAVVTTSQSPVSTATSVLSTPSATLYSPSSSESLARRHRARALSFSPVDASSSSAATSNPPSSLSHQHTPSTSPLANPQDRKHHLPPGASLSHSTSLYASGLRDTFPEQSLRRPSMPILAAEQTFSLTGAAITPQISILRSPASSTFTFPAAGASVSRSPPFSPAPSSTFGPQETLPHTIISSTVTTGPATMPRRASSAGLMNIGGVGGSLGRSSSVLTRSGGLLKKDPVKEAERAREKGREKEKKAKDKEDKAREKEKAKEKERSKDRGKEKEKERPKSRPKLSLATSGSTSTNNSIHGEQTPHYQVKSPNMESIMRRVRSGSNLRQTEPEAEQPTSPIREGYVGSSSKKKGVLVHGVERIVRGLDSALDFVDGKS